MTVSCPSNVHIAGHQLTSNRTGIAAGHQMMSNRPINATGFQRSRKDNLKVLLLRRLRRETPTAEEATKNSRLGARTRAGTSAGTLRNPAR